jgi:hypothetical protein
MNLVDQMKNAGLNGHQWRGKLITDGCASNCLHCGLPLTDGVSLETSMGPVCRKYGYNSEPENGDEILALGALAQWPELVDFLLQKWKPQGPKGLLNGLLRIGALNRRTPVHEAITDAVEYLGYRNLASALRKCLCVASVKESKSNPNFFIVWVKKSVYQWSWSRDIRVAFPQSYFSRAEKGLIIPKTGKRALWNLLISHYEGYVLETPDGKFVKIKKAEKKSDPPSAPEADVPPSDPIMERLEEKAEFAEQERAQEELGFASDPDFQEFQTA